MKFEDAQKLFNGLYEASECTTKNAAMNEVCDVLITTACTGQGPIATEAALAILAIAAGPEVD